MGTRRQRGLTENGYTLSASDLQFIRYLIDYGQPKLAYEKLMEWEVENKLRIDVPREDHMATYAQRLLKRPEIQQEYWLQMNKARANDVANATEVMKYFTQVMRGEIKDQFGLDASLADRTQAAKELAKRTVDMENRMAGKPDAVVAISLNWKRDRG